MFGPTSLKGMPTARSLLEHTIRARLRHPLANKSCRHLHLRLFTGRRRPCIPRTTTRIHTTTRTFIRPMDPECTSTHHGSGSGSVPASGMAGTSDGIALGDSVALAEGMGLAEGMAEDAEGIASQARRRCALTTHKAIAALGPHAVESSVITRFYRE
jgi:hypothetical protein